MVEEQSNNGVEVNRDNNRNNGNNEMIIQR